MLYISISSAIAEQQISETGTNPAPWMAEEQKLLEQGLKTYPASVPNRWDKIAEAIPTRSKKDCMKRYKVCMSDGFQCKYFISEWTLQGLLAEELHFGEMIWLKPFINRQLSCRY